MGTQNAGFTSTFFPKERGVNQGCPISPFLYNVVGEIMAHKIKENPKIRGVKLTKNGAENIITQFADDTGLFLIYDEMVINEAIKTLMYIETNTGLKVSYEKTCIYRVGSLKNTNAKIYTLKELQWSDGDIEMLGVCIRNEENQNTVQFDETLEKMHNVIKVWGNRQLSLMGKVLLINVLIGSLFVYFMQVLPLMSDEKYKSIEKVITNFLWDGKRPKIPISVLQLNKMKGGLNLVNLKQKHVALLVQWVKRINCEKCWDHVNEWLIPQLDANVWECNLNRTDILKLCKKDTYWKEMLLNWSDFHFSVPKTKSEICSQIIWGNSLIRINNEPISKHPVFGICFQKVEELLGNQNNCPRIKRFCRGTVLMATLVYGYGTMGC